MNDQKVRLPFCGKDLTLALPDDWRVSGVVAPVETPGLRDIKAGLLEALQHPVGCEPLGNRDLSGLRIVLAVDDISRPTPTRLFFGDLLQHLFDHGALKRDMVVVTALGVHREMTAEEMEGKLGRDAIRGIRCVNHDSGDIGSHADLGVTSRGTPVLLNRLLVDADLIICVGAIEPHLLLGFGGGLKMILPGLAHDRSIAHNHMQGVTPDRFNYIGARESPMRLDLEEAAGMLGREIHILNVLLNRDLAPCRFVCGDPVAAHRAGVELSRSMCGRPVQGLADVAIVVSNPMNADLRQGMKSIGNVEPCVRDNGLIVSFLECENGIGDVAIPDKAMPNRLLRFVLRRLGKDRVLWFIDKVKKGAGVEERFLAHFSLQIVCKNLIMVHSPNLPPDTGRRLGLFRQFEDPNEMIRVASRFAPRNARVHIFTHGGVTYPILGE